MAVVALDHLDRIRARADALLETNRALANAFLAAHPDIVCEPSQFGTTLFPRLRSGSAASFVALLREQFETSVVPGDFFEQPQHFRIGICGATQTLQGGLERLGRALEAFRAVASQPY
jgi:aspartate/methionine/tyrosine aminotransferase